MKYRNKILNDCLKLDTANIVCVEMGGPLKYSLYLISVIF